MPFRVDSLFDFTQPNTLGLSFAEGVETSTIFSPGEHDNKYNHGAVLFPFKGMLYAQWQSSAVDEDAADTRVFFSRSADGKIWAKPIALTDSWPQGIKTSGGWWSHADTLVAYMNCWPETTATEACGGYTEYRLSTDGVHWADPQPVKTADGQPLAGIIEQDMHALPGGRVLTAVHRQPDLVATPFYTDDPLGLTGWRAGRMQNLPFSGNTGRAIEPAWFCRKDGAIVMIFRDQQNTFKKLAAISVDNGAAWTTPVLIDTPDSRAKQSAGNLPDGTAFMVNNPSGNKNRFPLVITLSQDGFLFDRAYLLRGGDDLQPLRYAGKYKRAGYSYPKSVVWGEYLYVAYATNKEDIEVTRVPVRALRY